MTGRIVEDAAVSSSCADAPAANTSTSIGAESGAIARRNARNRKHIWHLTSNEGVRSLQTPRMIAEFRGGVSAARQRFQIPQIQDFIAIWRAACIPVAWRHA